MAVKGVRGSITVTANTENEILAATRELLARLAEKNQIVPEDIIAVFFSATSDLNQAYPARAAREMGWTDVPLMCFQEMWVENSLPMCIRVLIQFNQKEDSPVHPVYLRGASVLRPVWAEK